MYLRDLTIHAHEELVDEFKGGFVHRFHRETGCVTDHFLSLIRRRIETPDTAKLALTLSRFERAPQQLMNVVEWTRPFDFRAYRTACAEDRKRFVLDAMLDALMQLATARNWARDPIAEAHRTMLERELVFAGTSTDSWPSPDGRHRLRIHFVYDLDTVDLHALVFRNRSRREVGRAHVGRALAYPGCLRDYLKKGKWTSRTRFQLTAATFRKERWSVSFPELLGQS